MSSIHLSALIDPQAQLGPEVNVGPYTLIGPHVKIGAGTSIGSHSLIEGHTEIGSNCQISSHVSLGVPPQVRKQPSRSYLKIGDNNIIREYVTMHPGMHEDSTTLVGSRNFIMIGVHVAHDCILGSDLTLTNGVGMAGHVQLEDFVTVGGLAGIHQFVRVGKYAMVGALSKVASDVPPFVTCDGHPAVFYGINSIGLKRAGFSPNDRVAIRKSLKMMLASGKKLSTAVHEVEHEFPSNPHIRMILDFVKGSKRGIIRAGFDCRGEEDQ